MKLIEVDSSLVEKTAPLTADFRVTLMSYKGVEIKPDIESAKKELNEFLKVGYPVYAVEDNGEFVGYTVLRIENCCLWVEHIFVNEKARRKGVASMLFEKAEEVSRSMGGDTTFNFVHPNNQGMINFLRSKGYTVLNLIEIRKPFEGETLTTTVKVDNNTFDY